MITLGASYTLKVVKTVDFGVYLDALDLGEVLLPKKYLPENLNIGDDIDVFIYLDSEDRPVATTQQPKAKVGEFAFLRTVATTQIGAFLDWGLEKDLLVPFAEQHKPFEVEHSYLVYLYLDKRDGRITASSKLDQFINEEHSIYFKSLQKVALIIAQSTDLGYKAIINHQCWGVLYKNEVHQKIKFGQSITGYIKKIRSDGKIDLMLRLNDQNDRTDDSAIIINYLEKNKGFAPLHNKSSPATISELFNMSKGAFKRCIGGLYKQQRIIIKKDGIYLVK